MYFYKNKASKICTDNRKFQIISILRKSLHNCLNINDFKITSEQAEY